MFYSKPEINNHMVKRRNNLQRIDRFHRLKQMIPIWVRHTIDNSETIHGSRALNQQVRSPHLRTRTRDYDVYSNHPRRSARQTERYLDKQFGHNAFEVKRGKNPGTYKVKSRATGETYADYTRAQKKVPFRVIDGKRYATLAYHQKHAQQTLRSGTATHRKQKDIDMINRIKLSGQQNLSW